MTTFVVLAAGRGSRLGRIGDELPKCMLPLNGQAILSHQLALVPTNARVLVVAGYRAAQVQEYVYLAHGDRGVEVVVEENWGRGPGASLLEVKELVGDDDLVFVASDTLWTNDPWLWTEDCSWVAVAPVPAGTPEARWCRIGTDVTGEYATVIYDKVPDVVPRAHCWTAFAKIIAEDLPTFWAGLETADARAGEVQLSSGLDAVLSRGEPIVVRSINWLDVGDEQAFRKATATLGGYDALKPNQITYVLPKRVVKFHLDRRKVEWRATRAKLLGDAVPQVTETLNGTMIGYDFVEGSLLYHELEHQPSQVLGAVFDWWTERFWSTRRTEAPHDVLAASDRFYREKTLDRVRALESSIQRIALDAVVRVDWDALVDGVVPGVFHGDLTFANVVVWDDDWNLRFRAIDWREDYAGVVEWGDLRYDLAKLLTGARFHWHHATYGDFRRWDRGPEVEAIVENHVSARFPEVDLDDVRRIAALCLINSASLHAAPMDEILVARGCNWLETIT